MVDIATGIVALGAAVASKETLDKVLGATSEYIGGELKNFVQKCNVNLSDVFAASLKKGAANKTGNVNPRAASSIINDAAYCDDELIKDYYGGLLCSSKVDDGSDDAVPYISILKQMSQVQIKAHFLIYACMYKNRHEDIKSITLEEERRKMILIIDIYTLVSFLDKKIEDWESTVNHIASGLIRNEIIDNFFQYGDVEYLNKKLPNIKILTPSLVVKPTILGVELFLWASGIASPNPNIFLDKNANILDKFPEKYRNIIEATNLT